jgi:Ca2+-transporting ATPase
MTMAFTAFVYAQLVNVFNARSETATVFSKYTFSNWKLWASVVFVFVMQILLTVIKPLQQLFDVTALTPTQWGLCLLPPLLLLVVVELWKINARRVSADESVSVVQ